MITAGLLCLLDMSDKCKARSWQSPCFIDFMSMLFTLAYVKTYKDLNSYFIKEKSTLYASYPYIKKNYDFFFFKDTRDELDYLHNYNLTPNLYYNGKT